MWVYRPRLAIYDFGGRAAYSAATMMSTLLDGNNFCAASLNRSRASARDSSRACSFAAA